MSQKYVEISKKRIALSLLIVVAISIIFKMYLIDFSTFPSEDAIGHILHGIGHTNGNFEPIPAKTLGWSIFLSPFFSIMDSDNFLDYHNVQRFVGTIFSVATIVPVYVLCSRYFKKSYSLLGATLFIVDPRLIQNSFLGTPESIYIFLMATLLCLFLSDNFKKIYLAFGIAALLALARYEGLLMIIPLSAVFFVRYRKQKKDLIKYAICISIFILILTSMAYLRNETMGQDGFVSHISAGPVYYQASIQENDSTLTDFLYLGSINLIKYLGWAQIPSFIIFIPLGVLFLFRSLDYKKITIILSILIMLIPAFYGYSRGFQELKYLYVLYPIFCILACFTFKIFLEKFHRKNLIFCMIIVGLILSSLVFVDWKSMDNEHQREAFQIMSEISDKNMKINTDFGKDGNELIFLHWTRLQNVESFPTLKNSLPEIVIKYASMPGGLESRSIEMRDINEYGGWENRIDINNFEDYLTLLKKQKLTHLILDGEHNTPLFTNEELASDLKYIFKNEEDYPFLIKEYDSKENGYKYHLKLFRIDYDSYDQWLNEK